MSIGAGDGTTISFGTSGFNGSIVSIGGPDGSRAFIDSSHLGSTTWSTFIAAGLTDPGTVNLSVQYDPTTAVPVTAVAETITIDPAGSGSTLAFTGFVTDFSHSFAVGELMQLDMTLKISGAITGI